MGAASKEDKKAAGGGGGEKTKDANGPDSPAPGGSTEVVFQIDLHCAGCAKKVKRAVAGFQGVESTGIDMVPPDSKTGLLKVTGQLDPAKLHKLIEAKLHKKVKLVRVVPVGQPMASPPSDDAAEAKKPQPQQAPVPQGADGTREIKTKAAPVVADEKPKGAKQEATDEKPKAAKQEAADEKPQQPKAPAAPVTSTVVIRMRLHCDDCIVKLKKKMFRLKGVESVEADAIKELVTVKGTMDPAAVPAFLKEKTGRTVEVVSSPANKGGGDGEKKKGGDGDGAGAGEKKKEFADAGAEKSKAKQEKQQQQQQQPAATATANKMEYRGLTGEVAYAQPAPQGFAYSGYGGGGDQYASPYSSPYASYASPPPPQQQQYAYAYAGPDQAGPSSSYAPVSYPPYGNSSSGGGYYSGGSQMPPPGMAAGAGGCYPGSNGYFEQAPQMFSDENPNGCSVM